MKKALKIIGITLGSILGVLIIAIIIVCNIVFSPSKLTPIVKNNVSKFITCQADLDTVDLTFFSTFPHFSLHATNVTLVNPIVGAQSDTLAHIGDVSASINLTAFLFDQQLIIDHFTLTDAQANIYTDSAGNANYNIVPSSTEEEEDTTSSTTIFDLLQLESISIERLNASYIDKTLGINAYVRNINGYVSGMLQGANGDIYADLGLDNVAALYTDSSRIEAEINGTRTQIAGALRDNHFNGKIQLSLPKTTAIIDADTLANQLALNLTLPADINFDLMHCALHHATIAVNEHQIDLDGPIQLTDSNINLDVTATTNTLDITSLLALVPAKYTKALDGIDISGQIALNAGINGSFSTDTINPSMPIITANINLAEGSFSYPAAIPYKLNKIGADLTATINLNEGQTSNATINSIEAHSGSMWVKAEGHADDLMGNPACKAHVQANIDMAELKPLLPDSLNLKIKGKALADITSSFKLTDLTALKLNKIKANGSISYQDIDFALNDSIFASTPQGKISINLPIAKTNRQNSSELLEASLSASNLNLDMTDLLTASIASPLLKIAISNPLDTTKLPTARCSFSMDRLNGSSDTISFHLTRPEGLAKITPSKFNKKAPVITLEYANEQLKASMGKLLDIKTDKMKLMAESHYDKNGENIFLQLNPTMNVDLNSGRILYSSIPEINIPAIKFEFRPNDFNIERSRIVIQNSDFNLSGKVTNLRNFMKKRGLLEGDLLFESGNTSIDELMAIVNGMGTDTNSPDSVARASEAEVTKLMNANHLPEPNPFMVPKGVNLSFTTKIYHAEYSNMKLDSLQGRLTIKDGIAVVEQMGFTTEAAEMQLTGMYRSDRKNHLFAGFDFHLLNIDIHRLISMIPSIDTIVPMLKSFEGQAEFHIAAETYLNAWYKPKLSTLRAAAALEGKNLVLLDNETFSTIAKYMMFNKKTRNVVDSLSVEMTVFRNEIDLYPFLISMDKWQAVLSGRHNLDMSFNYHISLTDCPLPIRLGLDVKGNLDDLKFKLVPCKYKALYKPEKQKATDKRTLALKKLISDSLKDNVK